MLRAVFCRGARLGFLPRIYHLSGPHCRRFCPSPEKFFPATPPPYSQVEQFTSMANFPYLPFTKQGKQLERREPRLPYDDDEPLCHDFHPLALPVSPVVQVFSVSIDLNFDDLKRPSEIYGSIQATEEQGSTFISLYSRDSADPESILKHGSLSLTSNDNFISCYVDRTTTMQLCLKDRTRDIEIIKGQLVLHSKSEDIQDSCDKLIKAVVQGEYGSAVVYYTTFKFAVRAKVTVEISETNDASRPYADIYGSITAGYGNTTQYCSRDEEVKFMKTSLFSKSSNQSVRTMVASPIELSRRVVVVPAYSSLIIEAHLLDARGVFTSGSLEFPAHKTLDTKVIGGDGGAISVKVYFGSTFKNRHCIEAWGSDGEEKVDPRFSPFGCIPLSMPSSSIWSSAMLEVFSIDTVGFAHKPSVLGGEIVFYGSTQTSIYQKGLSNPEIFSPCKSTIPFQCHRDLDNTYFFLMLYLKDLVRDLDICSGYFTSQVSCFDEWMHDRRLCVVVRGAHGYAVIHYMMIKEAYAAVVEITFFSNDACPVDVYGGIFARYSSHGYSTAYEKTWYRSRLFDKVQGESVQVSTNSELPLLKSVVAVPANSSLIIEADLKASSLTSLMDETLCGMSIFKIEPGETDNQTIQGTHFSIQVSVLSRLRISQQY